MKHIDNAALAKGAMAGLVAGLAGSAAMSLYSYLWSRTLHPEKEPEFSEQGTRPDVEEARAQDEGAGALATSKVAQSVAEPVVDRNLTEDEKHSGGKLVHYAYGSAAGALYGVAAERFPKAAESQLGIPYGLALWACGILIALPGMGLIKQPTEYKAKEHAFGFLGHIVFGLTLEATRRLIRSR